MGQLATGFLQFEQRKSAGRIQEREAKVAASQAELEAVSREGDRKSRLAKALASQTASAGARGISAFEGSPLAVLQADIEAEERGTERDVFQSRLEALTLRSRGKIARKQATAAATVGLLKDIGQTAERAAGAAGS